MRSILIFFLVFLFMNHGYTQSRHVSAFIKGTYDEGSGKYIFSEPKAVDITVRKKNKEYYLINETATYVFKTDFIISESTTVNGEKKVFWYTTDQNGNYCALINIITLESGKESLAILYPKAAMLIYYYDKN